MSTHMPRSMRRSSSLRIPSMRTILPYLRRAATQLRRNPKLTDESQQSGETMSPITPRIVSLVGAPTDIGASDRGASMGPEAMRVAGLPAALTQRGLEVVDCGNVSGPANPCSPAVDGYRHLPEVFEWNRNVHDAVYRDLTLGNL